MRVTRPIYWSQQILKHETRAKHHQKSGQNQGRIQKIQKEGAKETDDAVLHHSGSICDQTLGLTLRTFQKYRKKGGAAAPLPPPPLNPPMKTNL